MYVWVSERDIQFEEKQTKKENKSKIKKKGFHRKRELADQTVGEYMASVIAIGRENRRTFPGFAMLHLICGTPSWRPGSR